jgi:hypothetical protein
MDQRLVFKKKENWFDNCFFTFLSPQPVGAQATTMLKKYYHNKQQPNKPKKTQHQKRPHIKPCKIHIIKNPQQQQPNKKHRNKGQQAQNR